MRKIKPMPSTFRSGFACLIGRPNVGKSTLLNAMVGSKIAITSPQPQTTRRIIRGIITRDDGQLILVDTPGVHKPRTLLGERLTDAAKAAWADVDVVVFCIPADQDIGPGDRRIIGDLTADHPTLPVVGVVTKTDLVAPDRVARQLVELSHLREFAEIIPVSARESFQVSLLTDLLMQQLPEGPRLYLDDEKTDTPTEIHLAELIREAALDGVREELPHSLAVRIDEMTPRESRPHITDIYATIFVERDSQKGIVIGKRGSRLATVGRRSRLAIERELGAEVFLHLHVAVAKNWQRDPKQLRKLGFDE